MVVDKLSLINEIAIKEEAIRIKQSDTWFNKLNQVISIDTFVSHPDDLKEQYYLYKKALILFKSYNSETFEFGKKGYLQEKEADVKTMLGDFPIRFINNANIIADSLTHTLKYYYNFLLNNKEWMYQKTYDHKPIIISQKDMDEFEIKTANIISLFSSKTNALEKLISQLELLKVENLRRKEILRTLEKDITVNYCNEE